MSKISSTMNVAQRSMMNAQTGLQTVSHNVANKNTEGYSRQRVDYQSTPPAGIGRVQIGTGAKAQAVTRVNNPQLEKQIQTEQQKFGYGESKTAKLDRVEMVFNEQANKGLNHYMGELFNSFRELANNPESLPIRTQVKEAAVQLTQDFKRVNSQLKTIQKEIDNEVSMEIEEVNRITAEIADLNQKVESIEITGSKANDHRDRRDALLKQLSDKMNIKYSEVDSGKVNITAGNSISLVSGYDSTTLKTGSTPATNTKRESNFDVFAKVTPHSSDFVITDQLIGGKIGGALEVRDKTINEYLKKLDSLAFELSTNINEIHNAGYDQKSRPATSFFKMDQNEYDLSERIEVNQMIQKDVSYIASAQAPNAPADNRIANSMAALQHKPLMKNGLDTLDDFYGSMVGELSVITRKTRAMHEHQADSLTQLKNIRESISGVSLDEETIKMIEYQKAFDASAKLIQTVDQMLDTVINIKR